MMELKIDLERHQWESAIAALKGATKYYEAIAENKNRGDAVRRMHYQTAENLRSAYILIELEYKLANEALRKSVKR